MGEHRPGEEPLTLAKYHNCELPQLYEALEGVGGKSVCPSPQIKCIKGRG